MKTGMRRLLGMMFAVILMATALQARDHRFESTYQYEVDPGFRLSIDNVSGDVAIIFRPGDQVIVNVVKEVDASSRAKAEELEDQIEVRIDADRGSIDIETRYPRNWNRSGFLSALFGGGEAGVSVSYQIEVPVAVDMSVSTTSGDLSVEGVEGKLDVESTSGDIDISDFRGDCSVKNTSGDFFLRDISGNIEINSTSADALIDNVQGSVELRCTSGDSEFHWIDGNVYVSKTSGDVRVEECSGDIDVNTSSGDIHVLQRSGGLFLATSSGDIEVESDLNGGGKYEIETVSGDITVRVPGDASGRVRIETVSGEIDTDLPLEVHRVDERRLEGSFGEGGVLMDLRSASGDIALSEF